MIGPAPSPETIDALVKEVRAQLAANGTAIADVGRLAVPVDVWRKAARRAGKILGRPVRTVLHGGAVEAYLVDWPANPDEQRKRDRVLRAAIERAAPIWPTTPE